MRTCVPEEAAEAKLIRKGYQNLINLPGKYFSLPHCLRVIEHWPSRGKDGSLFALSKIRSVNED